MSPSGAQQLAFPKPGRALKTVRILLFGVWLVFALGMNWGGVSPTPFFALTGNTTAILSGEVWRLFTAPLLHVPTGSISHIVFTMLMLYFFGSSLEEAWGPKRFVQFLILSGALSYGAQVVLSALLPASIGNKLVPEHYFGGSPVVEACIIAWACSFRGRTVLLFFVVPVGTRTLIYLTVGANVLMLIAGAETPSGHIALFGGMGAGWLLGGDSPSPLRKFYLKYRLSQLEREAEDERRQKKKRVERSGLQVLPGGKDEPRPPKDFLN
jgi:membrane associated rhomboid family serine protease